jgi:hypothetical protein
MGRPKPGDESQLVLYCQLPLGYSLYIFMLWRGIQHYGKVAPWYVNEAILVQMRQRLSATVWQICNRYQRVLVTLWQIFTGNTRVLETLWQFPQRVLATFSLSTHLPEGCQHPRSYARVDVLVTLGSISQRLLVPQETFARRFLH